MNPKSNCGQPVRDADFVGRVEDVRRLRARLGADHVLLSAPRRVGKTSVMHHLHRVCSGTPEWAGVAYYTAEADSDEAAFVAGLFAAVARSPGATGVAAALRDRELRTLLGKVARVEVASVALELRQAVGNEWRRLAAAFADGLAGLPPGRPLLIMVDELPVFLTRLLEQDRGRAEVFLGWLRGLRQGGPERGNPARWLVAGSIGLAPLAARERWSHLINDLATETLGALTDSEARALLDGLAATHEVALPAAERDALLARLGWPLPYFVERMLDACAGPEGAPRSVLEEAVLGFWTDDERDDRRRALLECLDHDGYLVWDTPRWRFRSPLLREVWRARRSR